MQFRSFIRLINDDCRHLNVVVFDLSWAYARQACQARAFSRVLLATLFIQRLQTFFIAVTLFLRIRVPI